MATHRNGLGQPVGAPLPGWQPPPSPPRRPLAGRYCRIEPLDPQRHAEGIHTAVAEQPDGRLWTYMAYGPFDSLAAFGDWMRAKCLGDDPLFYAICAGAEARPLGLASYLRITPASGSMEVGHLLYPPALQRTRAATEAMFLMMEQAFALGYRRYEWKCDALNSASCAAAQRLGFSFEGIFRQAAVYKERSRDTAWFSIIDSEWPRLRDVFAQWLDPANFDDRGQQRQRLSRLTAALRGKT